MNVQRERVAIIGAGTVGQVLGRRLRRAGGYEIVGVCRRSIARARAAARWIGGGRATIDPAEAVAGATLILIAAPDRAIPEIADRLGRRDIDLRGACVIHVSGALPSTVLAPARRRGARIAAAHPLQSFPDPQSGIRRLDGAWWACEGDREAWARVHRLVRACGGREFHVSAGAKAAYHAGAVFASNYLVALADLAVAALGRGGVARSTALRALLPLMRGTLENIGRLGTVKALTGPIARGDAITVRGHEAALRRGTEGPALWAGYAALGRHALRLARARGSCPPDAAREIASILGADRR